MAVLLALLSTMGTSSHFFGPYDPVFTSFFENGTVNLAVIPEYAKITSDQGTDTSKCHAHGLQHSLKANATVQCRVMRCRRSILPAGRSI